MLRIPRKAKQCPLHTVQPASRRSAACCGPHQRNDADCTHGGGDNCRGSENLGRDLAAAFANWGQRGYLGAPVMRDEALSWLQLAGAPECWLSASPYRTGGWPHAARNSPAFTCNPNAAGSMLPNAGWKLSVQPVAGCSANSCLLLLLALCVAGCIDGMLRSPRAALAEWGTCDGSSWGIRHGAWLPHPMRQNSAGKAAPEQQGQI